MPFKSSTGQILIDVILFIVLILTLLKPYRNKRPITRMELYVVIFLILLFCLFPFWGSDYWHYLLDYNDIRAGGKSNMEDVYHFIIRNITSSYFAFRLLIWGTAILLLLNMLNSVKANMTSSLFFFVIFFLPLFSYARVSLAMSMMFCGLAVLTVSRKRLLKVLLGIGLIAASYYFHKSAAFGIAIIIIAIGIEFNPKMMLTIIILSLPLLVSYMRSGLIGYMNMSFEGEENQALFTGQLYMDSEQASNGMSAAIRMFIQRIAPLLIIFLYLIIVYKSEYKQLPLEIRVFANAAAFCIIVSYLLFFAGNQFNMTSVSYRLSLFSWLPSIVFLSYCREVGIHKKLVSWIIAFGFLSTSYSLVYSLYNSF